MRRLVGISSQTTKTIIILMTLAIVCTSLHMAAAARIASLRREQERLEQSAIKDQGSIGSQPLSTAELVSGGKATPAQPERSAVKAEPRRKNAASLPSVATTKSSNAMPGRKRRIIISIPDRKLALLEDGHVLKTYPIAIGARHTPSPDGEFVIVNRAKDPVYRHRDKEIPPGKDNPLGTRWMGLSMKGYGIHGTNAQSSVGKAASHGCFRMRKQDVEELYTLVQVGDPVTVRRERDAAIAGVFAAPANEPAMMLAKSEANTETEIAAANATTVETTEQ
jgi:lipoprotein-anchoring transpeptidase ErfK/SrfK